MLLQMAKFHSLLKFLLGYYYIGSCIRSTHMSLAKVNHGQVWRGMGKQSVPAGRQGKSHDRGRKRYLWLIWSTYHLCFINERRVIITHSQSPLATHYTFGARDAQLICVGALLPHLFPRTYVHTTGEAIRKVRGYCVFRMRNIPRAS